MRDRRRQRQRRRRRRAALEGRREDTLLAVELGVDLGREECRCFTQPSTSARPSAPALDGEPLAIVAGKTFGERAPKRRARRGRPFSSMQDFARPNVSASATSIHMWWRMCASTSVGTNVATVA
jgi:hypothetical protein